MPGALGNRGVLARHGAATRGRGLLPWWLRLFPITGMVLPTGSESACPRLPGGRSCVDRVPQRVLAGSAHRREPHRVGAERGGRVRPGLPAGACGWGPGTSRRARGAQRL